MNQVNRGGSWYDVVSDCQLVYRDYDSLDYRYDSLGFRLAKYRNRSRMFRGGCWHSHPRIVRAAYRLYDTPGYRYAYLGFRLARRKP